MVEKDKKNEIRKEIIKKIQTIFESDACSFRDEIEILASGLVVKIADNLDNLQNTYITSERPLIKGKNHDKIQKIRNVCADLVNAYCNLIEDVLEEFEE